MYYDLDSLIDAGNAYVGCSVRHVLLTNPQYLRFMEKNGFMKFTPRVQVYMEIASERQPMHFMRDQMVYFIDTYFPKLVLN